MDPQQRQYLTSLLPPLDLPAAPPGKKDDAKVAVTSPLHLKNLNQSVIKELWQLYTNPTSLTTKSPVLEALLQQVPKESLQLVLRAVFNGS